MTVKLVNVTQVFGVDDEVSFQKLPLLRSYIGNVMVPEAPTRDMLKRFRSGRVLPVRKGNSSRASLEGHRRTLDGNERQPDITFGSLDTDGLIVDSQPIREVG